MALKADEQTLHAAIMDVIDGQKFQLYEFNDGWLTITEDRANRERLDFADAVIKRVRELKAPEPDGADHVQVAASRRRWGTVSEKAAIKAAFISHLEAADAWERAAAACRRNDPRYKVLREAAQTATGLANDATNAAPANVAAFNATADALLNASIHQHTLASEAHRRAADAYAVSFEEDRDDVRSKAIANAMAGLVAKGLVDVIV